MSERITFSEVHKDMINAETPKVTFKEFWARGGYDIIFYLLN